MPFILRAALAPPLADAQPSPIRCCRHPSGEIDPVGSFVVSS
jgi:hypothetical protein